MPNMGCMLGTAYQCLVGQLGSILEKELPGVSVPEYMILRSLYSCNGLQQCEIGEIVGKDKGAVSRTVKGMISKGLVRTESVSHKCLKVFLTPEAESIRKTVLRIADSRQRALEEILVSDKISIFSECLVKIIES